MIFIKTNIIMICSLEKGELSFTSDLEIYILMVSTLVIVLLYDFVRLRPIIFFFFLLNNFLTIQDFSKL